MRAFPYAPRSGWPRAAGELPDVDASMASSGVCWNMYFDGHTRQLACPCEVPDTERGIARHAGNAPEISESAPNARLRIDRLGSRPPDVAVNLPVLPVKARHFGDDYDGPACAPDPVTRRRRLTASISTPCTV